GARDLFSSRLFAGTDSPGGLHATRGPAAFLHIATGLHARQVVRVATVVKHRDGTLEEGVAGALVRRRTAIHISHPGPLTIGTAVIGHPLTGSLERVRREAIIAHAVIDLDLPSLVLPLSFQHAGRSLCRDDRGGLLGNNLACGLSG